MFHLYGLLLGIGIVSGVFIAQKQARHFGKNSQMIDEAILWTAIPAVIGARLYHVITDWPLYEQRPLLEMVKIWEGGLGFFGALIGGIVGILFLAFQQKKKYPISSNQSSAKNEDYYFLSPVTRLFTLMDLLSFGAPLAQAIGRLGNFFNQELYGLPTNLPWGISIRGETYHPLFAYEALLNLAVFTLLNWLGWKKKLLIGKGQYACVYLACYGLIRFWLEFLRIETARWENLFGIFSIAQWFSVGITIVATTVFWLRRHVPRKEWDVSLD